MQVAVVTGASSGIGYACATQLAEMGMAVVGTGRDPDRLTALADAIGDPDRVATLAVDLTDVDARDGSSTLRCPAGATSTFS